jgi:two-component system, OmpR family, response regulator
MHVLLVEDDEVLASGILSSLEQSGYQSTHIGHGTKANELLESASFDVVVLDLTLPGMDGSEVLRRLRERGTTTPVLVLSARNTLQDRVFGLDLGADDYVTKPFQLPELEARIRALLRRGDAGETFLSTGISLDPSKRKLTYEGKTVELSSREMDLLKIFLDKKGEVVLREQLRNEIQTAQGEFTDNAVEVYVHRLRKKLNELGLELKTIRGLGYMLNLIAE